MRSSQQRRGRCREGRAGRARCTMTPYPFRLRFEAPAHGSGAPQDGAEPTATPGIAGILRSVAGRRSPVAGRRSPVAGRRSPVAGRRRSVRATAVGRQPRAGTVVHFWLAREFAHANEGVDQGGGASRYRCGDAGHQQTRGREPQGVEACGGQESRPCCRVRKLDAVEGGGLPVAFGGPGNCQDCRAARHRRRRIDRTSATGPAP